MDITDSKKVEVPRGALLVIHTNTLDEVAETAFHGYSKAHDVPYLKILVTRSESRKCIGDLHSVLRQYVHAPSKTMFNTSCICVMLPSGLVYVARNRHGKIGTRLSVQEIL